MQEQHHNSDLSAMTRLSMLYNTLYKITKDISLDKEYWYRKDGRRTIVLTFNSKRKVLHVCDRGYILTFNYGLNNVETKDVRDFTKQILSVFFDKDWKTALSKQGYFDLHDTLRVAHQDFYIFFKEIIDKLLFFSYLNSIRAKMNSLKSNFANYKNKDISEHQTYSIEHETHTDAQGLSTLLVEFIKLVRYKSTKYYELIEQELCDNFLDYKELSDDNIETIIGSDVQYDSHQSWYALKPITTAIMQNIINDLAIDINSFPNEIPKYCRNKLHRINDKKSLHKHFFFSQANPLQLQEKELQTRINELKNTKYQLSQIIALKTKEYENLRDKIISVENEIETLKREIIKTKAKNKAFSMQLKNKDIFGYEFTPEQKDFKKTDGLRLNTKLGDASL